MTTGESLHTFRGQVNAVNGVAFSPDGKRLVSGSLAGTVQVWDAQTSRRERSEVPPPGTCSDVK